MPFDAVFDATNIPPQQGGGKHPVGNKFPFEITNTLVKSTKDGKGGIFEVELTSQFGSIKSNYNLWNESDTARKIAQQELSALCHATGRFQIDFKNDGAALRGGRGLMDIGFQKGQEPSAEKPEGGYVELKKVYDVNGNEPAKAGGAAPANGAWGGQQSAPQQQQPQPQPTQWQPQPNGAAPSVQSGWNGSNQPPANPSNAAQQGGGWQQGSQPTNPPWKA